MVRRVLPSTLIMFSLAGCVSVSDTQPATPTPKATEPAKPAYPAAWFAPLPPEVKPYSWEITPDAAAPGEVILSKRNELGILSNFAPTPFEIDGKRYASLEGFWQAMYYPDGADDPRQEVVPKRLTREQVEQLASFDAKKAGDEAKKALRQAGIAWISYQGRRFDPHGSEEDQKFHYDLILRATRAKVDQNAEVKRILLATEGLVLKPDHEQVKDATPAWRYFDILTAIRADLKRAP
jgi:predicted NAD-dependent protein-ADP-ribosyltransferase YbiA (DUF1768 family)